MKNVEDIYTLSSMQQGMLFHTLYAPQQGVYFQQLSCKLKGDLNVSAFKQAWQQVVARHSTLRTAFIWDGLDEPLQVVHKRVDLPWIEDDWRYLSPTNQQEHLEALLQAERNRGFELNQAPLMRCTLIQIEQTSYYFIWSHHHLLLDGWCCSIIFKEVFAFYESLSQGKDLYLETPRPYRDYIAWLQQQDLSQARAFWQHALQGFTVPTPLIADKDRGKRTQQQTYDEESLHFSKAATAALQSFVQRHHFTLNTLVQGAWALLLSRYSGNSDVVFGFTVSGRPPELVRMESMVGLFINTLPVRCQVRAEAELLPWLHQLQVQQIEQQQYSYSPLAEIQGWSDVPRELPLFESIVVFENYPVDASWQEGNSSLEISDVRTFDRTNYPLTVIVGPDLELSFRISYDSSRFAPTVIRRMLGHFQTILTGMVANPKQYLCELPLLTDAERHQLLVEWNDTQAEYPHQCLHQLFEEQVKATPDAIAVMFEDQTLSYRELNAKANQLAHYLQALGVRPEVLVGICVERSLLMVVGLLGILKAGGAYVPLDPAYPQERLAFMLEDAQVSVLLTQERLLPSLPENRAHLVGLDTDWGRISQQHLTENPVCGVKPENLAYVIYTSGSTGRPKGAMNTHQGISHHLFWMQQTYQLTAEDRVLQKTPFSFDVSAWELFWPLLSGARLVMAQPGGHQNSAYLVNLIAEQKITTVHFVPSMLQVFLEQERLESCSCLQRVFCSGEALPIELQQRFFARLGCELHNLYGPTEAAIHVTFWPCERHSSWGTVPIGRPTANTQIYILAPDLQPVPIGIPGEVHIGGVGLARGYLNRPELTEAKFIPNPFSEEPEARLYKTGDQARYLEDGNIQFLGRLDDQVKLRGFRIELGEIEAALSQHPCVRQTVVIVREDQPGNKQLVAYVVPYQESPHPSELRTFLKEKLAEYTIPSAFVLQSALPLTPSGKIDRRALPAPDANSRSIEHSLVPRRTPTEKTLTDIWTQILGLEALGIHDNFFELGGHSLLATQLISRVRAAFSVEIPLRLLFELPTVAELAQEIEKLKEKDVEVQAPAIVFVSRETRRIKRSSLMENGDGVLSATDND